MAETSKGKLDQQAVFIEKRAAGFSYDAISRELGVSKQTLINWSKDLSFQIQNARALRLDELAQRYAVAKEKRIEAFGQRLAAILAELDKRKLEDLETDKLLQLALKYGEMLREDDVPLLLKDRWTLTDSLQGDTLSWQG